MRPGFICLRIAEAVCLALAGLHWHRSSELDLHFHQHCVRPALALVRAFSGSLLVREVQSTTQEQAREARVRALRGFLTFWHWFGPGDFYILWRRFFPRSLLGFSVDFFSSSSLVPKHPCKIHTKIHGIKKNLVGKNVSGFWLRARPWFALQLDASMPGHQDLQS